MPHQTASHLDQLDLHAPQRPVLDRLGQTQPAKEVPKVVRQDEQRQTHPVGLYAIAAPYIQAAAMVANPAPRVVKPPGEVVYRS